MSANVSNGPWLVGHAFCHYESRKKYFFFQESLIQCLTMKCIVFVHWLEFACISFIFAFELHFLFASHFVIILFDHFVWPRVKNLTQNTISTGVLELDKNEMISIQISHSEQGSLVTWPNLATTAPCTIANINWNSINLNFVGMHVASRECLL